MNKYTEIDKYEQVEINKYKEIERDEYKWTKIDQSIDRYVDMN